MKRRLDDFLAVLDDRTGIPSGIRHFLGEDIPASSGWHQVFGSVALFMILVQFFTGILLAFNYAPTPGQAYDSLHYIITEVTGGRLMRGLHHWGASMVIVIVVLHMVQVFVWGAYKKPREATWIAGVILLLLTLAYGLTGYLLPWDNRAYWGTVVTTQIGASVPGAGPWVSRLLGSSGEIGVVTFARFYALHVLLLPPLTMLLIGFHIFLVRRHGVAPQPQDEGQPKKKFFPQQVFRDTVAIFVAFAILFTLAAVARIPLERMADPTDTSYIPRPEWYFLFLFQSLKLFEGPLELVGTVVLPTLAILALIATPFIDRSRLVRVRQRTLAIGIVALAGIGWSGLTLAAVRGTPPQTAAGSIDFSGPVQWMQLRPAELAGVHYFQRENCSRCHNVLRGGEAKAGPVLADTARRHDREWMLKHFSDPQSTSPGTAMPPVDLTASQMGDLAAAVSALTPESGDLVAITPEFASSGAVVYQKYSCGGCHIVNGVGGKIGPNLNGLAARRTEAWTAEHFINPQKLSPGTPMPVYPLATQEMQDLISWLFTLPEKSGT